MSKLIDAAIEVHDWLLKRRLPHFFIGGLAVQRWGEPRFTQDVDVCIVAQPEGVKGLVQELLKAFQPRIDGAAELAMESWILLLTTSSGFPLDVTLAALGPEEDMNTRAVEVEMEPGRTLPICSAEDLVLYKATADRGKDASDLEGIITRQGPSLDVGRIRRLLKQLCAAIDEGEPLERFERAWAEFGPEAKD